MIRYAAVSQRDRDRLLNAVEKGTRKKTLGHKLKSLALKPHYDASIVSVSFRIIYFCPAVASICTLLVPCAVMT